MSASGDPGGRIRAGAGAGAGDKPDFDSAEREYFARATEKIAAARSGSPSLTSMEFHVVDAWWQASVPLWLMLESFDAAAGLWMPGEAPRSFIRTVEKEIASRTAERPDGAHAPGGSAAVAADDAVSRACRALRGQIEEALERCHPEHDALRASLVEALCRIQVQPATMSLFEKVVTETRAAVAAAAETCAPEEERIRTRRAALASLGERAGHLPPASRDDMVHRISQERFLERLSLPSFSLLEILQQKR